MADREVESAVWETKKAIEDLSSLLETHFSDQKGVQKDILKSLQSGRNDISQAIKKMMAFSKAAEKGARETQKDTRQVKKLREQHLKSTKVQKVYTSSIRGARTALDKFSSGLQKTSQVLVAGIAGVAAAALTKGTEYFNMSLDLERAGLSTMLRSQTGTASALRALGQITQQSGMTLGQTNELLNDFGSAIGKYGVKEFAGGVQQITGNLSRFAVTTDEAGEFLGNYLETQRKLGMLENVDRMRQRQAAQRVYEDTIAFSKALRISREEALKRQQDALDTIDAQFLFDSMGELGKKAEEEFRKVATALPGLQETVLKGIDAAAFRGTANAAEAIQELRRQGATGIADAVAEISNTIASGGEITKEKMTSLFKGISDKEFEIIGAIQGMDAKAAKVAIKQFLSTVAEGGNPLKEQADDQAQAQRTLINVYNKVIGTLQKTIAEVVGSEGVIEALQSLIKNGIGPVVDAMIKYAPKVEEFLKGFAKFLSGGVTKGMEGFSNFMSDFMDSENKATFVFQKIGTGILSAFKDLVLHPIKNAWMIGIAALFAPSVVTKMVKGFIGAAKYAMKTGAAGSAASAATKGATTMGGIRGIVGKAGGLLALTGIIQGSVEGVSKYFESVKKGRGQLMSASEGIAEYGKGFFDSVIGNTASLVDFFTGSAFDLKKSWQDAKKSLEKTRQEITTSKLDFLEKQGYFLSDPNKVYDKISKLTDSQREELIKKLEKKKEESWFGLGSSEQSALTQLKSIRGDFSKPKKRQSPGLQKIGVTAKTTSAGVYMPSREPVTEEEQTRVIQKQAEDRINKAVADGDNNKVLQIISEQISNTNMLLKKINSNTERAGSTVYGQ